MPETQEATALLERSEAWYQFMPAMGKLDFERLRDSIRRHGILPGQEPVVDEVGRILDGYHRVKAASEEGVPCPTRYVGRVMTDEEKWDYVWAVNVPRRHLTIEQKRELIKERLRRHPEESNRRIADDVGADDKTVAAAREQLEETAEIPHFEPTQGGRGVTKRTRVTEMARCAACEAPVSKPIMVDGDTFHERCAPEERAEPADDAISSAADHRRMCYFELIVGFPEPSEVERARGLLPYPREATRSEWRTGRLYLTTSPPLDEKERVALFTELARTSLARSREEMALVPVDDV